MKRWIMHVDMDAFFASVEQLDNPDLQGKPVIVGGGSARGVVSTCSYEARKFGVHSAMPLFEARRLCPQGIYVPGRMSRYTEVSAQIMKIFSETSPLVEQLSIDEAFLDLTGMELLGGAEYLAHQVQNRIKTELGLNASVGLAPNKFLAKLASDLQKPRGFVVIRAEEAQALLETLPVGKIFGIGRKAEAKLLQYGIVTVGDLAVADLTVLTGVFGSNALMVHNLALGLDNRPVINDEPSKSIGKETTFAVDYDTYESCRDFVLDLSGQVGWRLRKAGLAGHTVTLKVKYSDFRTITRSVSANNGFVWDEDIFGMADSILKKINVKEGVRLLGVTVSNLMNPNATPDLGFEDDARLEKRNKAVDVLKSKFGEQIIKRGVVK